MSLFPKTNELTQFTFQCPSSFNYDSFLNLKILKSEYTTTITVKHILGYENKAADCLSQLPFITRKQNDNPLKDEKAGISVLQTEDDTICCPLCEVDLTDTKTLQQEDRYCI